MVDGPPAPSHQQNVEGERGQDARPLPVCAVARPEALLPQVEGQK